MRHLYSKFWWILFGRGLFGIALGVLAVIWLIQITQSDMDSFGMMALLKQAVIAQVVLVLLSAYAFMDGLFALVLGFQNYGEGRRWWGLVMEGVLGMAFALAFYFRPDLAVWALYDWVVFWAIFSGIFVAAQAFDNTEYWDRRRSYLGMGVVSILFGFFLVHFSDHIGVMVIGILAGYAMFFGTLLLRMGLRFRHFWEEWRKIKHGAQFLRSKG